MTTIRTRLLATSMITGLALIAMPAGAAFAADATADASPMATMDASSAGPAAAAPVQQLRATADATAQSTTTGEIIVTGSRIPQPNLTAVSPIQAVGHQQFQLQGTTDVVDLLNTLPSNFQNNTTDFSNTTNPLTAPGGITTADLRGLGPQRTLVLVNGRRLGIGDPNTGNPNPAPDLDQIPVALIDHVEVLTGGASATYGSDAIAGVVNFIMKSDFEGVQLDGTLGINQHDNGQGWIQNAIRASGSTPATGSVWDGKSSDFSVIMGANAPDGKGNVTGYFEFRHATPVTEGDRDYSGCLLVVTGNQQGHCANSSNSNLFQPIIGGVPGAAFSVVGNQLLPRPQAGSVPPATFNSSPYEYLSRDDNRYLAGFFAHYEITPWAQPYAEFMFMQDRSHSSIAPSGLFQGGGLAPGSFGNWFVNCNNPLLSAQQQGVIGCTPAMIAAGDNATLNIGRRNIEGGPRTADYEHNNYRIVLGLKGDIGDAWHYDGYGSYYFTSLFNSNGGYLSISGIQNGLLVGGTAANPFCLGGQTGCVPYNLFQQGGVTQAALNYLTEVGTSHGSIEESIFEFNLTGDLGKYGWKSPWANDGIGVDFGTESRWDRLIFAPDQAELSGDLSGFAGASVAVNNAIGVQEGYFETRIPIAQKQPFAEDLYLEGGVRYSDYSTSGGVTTFKVGGQWSPVEAFTLRGSYDRAIRAASILEAFTPQSVTNTSVVSADPCAPTLNSAGGLVLASATLAQCERTGVTAAQYGNGGTTNTIIQCPAGQCAVLQGGNAQLSPEVSDSWSIGGLFRPTGGFLRGFSGSIDYWDITIAGEIGNVPLTVSLANCLNGVQTTTFCPNVVRTPTGSLFGTTIPGGGYIIGTNQNIAAAHVSGVDFQGDYRLNLEDMGVHGWGSLSFHFVGTLQVSNQTTTLPGQPTFDCAGLFGPTCATVDPKWRHTFDLTWDTPWNVLARLQWRYIGESTLDSNSTQPGLTAGPAGFDAANNRLTATNYLDLSGAWRVNTILTVRAGINNILDEDPPIISQTITGTGAPNTYPTYDLLGRQMFISATAKF